MGTLNPLFERNIPVVEADDGISESFRSLNTEKTEEHKEKLLYLMFENVQNNCWLDASIVLIANSKAFEDDVEEYPNSEIKSIITTYKKALSILNDSNGLISERMEKTRNMLQSIQNRTLNYLKQFLKFKSGEPESAFCALLNLIYRDDSKIKENMNVSWIWQKNCDNCGVSRSKLTKPIITLPKVNEFNPESPTCVYTCSSCKKEQEMKLVYKELPNCLIFHFEKGAGTGNNIPLSFKVYGREYHLTGVILLEKSKHHPYLNINHFVTWIRQPSVDMWLDCNDLNTNIVQYGRKQPEWELNDLYMCVYEANDNLGKISHDILADSEQTEEVNAEVIYLSDEGDDVSNASKSAQNGAQNSAECSTTDNLKSDIFLSNYSNDSVEQSKNDLHEEVISNNDDHGAFLTESSQDMFGIKETCDLEGTNFIHQNMSLIDDQHGLFKMSDDVNCEIGKGSENCESGTVSLNVPEIQSKSEETHPEGATANVFNQKSELSHIIFLNKNDTSKKSTENSEVGAASGNRDDELPGKSKENPKQKGEAKGSGVNPNFGRRPARPRPKLSEERARELEHLIDTVTTNVFSNFMGFICEQHEQKNS